MISNMHTFNSVLLFLAACLTGCTGSDMKPIQVNEITRIEFRPVGGNTNALTNATELVLVVGWFNEAIKNPVSEFNIKSYPKPIHAIVVEFKSGRAETILISGGRPDLSKRDRKNSQFVEHLTVLSARGKQFITKSRPEFLFPLPSLEKSP